MSLNEHHGILSSVKLDKKYIVTGGADRLVKVWDTGTKECVQTLVGHEGEVSAIQFDEDYIVSAGEDATVRVRISFFKLSYTSLLF
jgi:WD40 repeat protein